MALDSTAPSARPVVLVPGHWLGGWAWDEVVASLDALGVPSVAVTLPGMDPEDPDRAARGLEEQADHLERILVQTAGTSGPVVLVAHSGGNLPAMRVLGRRPDLVAHIVWVDSGPQADGTVFAPELSAEVVEVPLPSFAELGQGASLEGLTEQQLERFRERAVPQPGPVMRDVLRLEDGRWRDLPATMVCSSLSSQDVRDLAAAGHPMMAPVAEVRELELVDLPTGHWPLWSRPDDLAKLLALCARRAASGAV